MGRIRRIRISKQMARILGLIALAYVVLMFLFYYPLQTIPFVLVFLIIFVFILVKSRKAREFFKNIFIKKPVSPPPPQSLKEAVLRHARYRCQNCGLRGRHVKLEVHHIVPRSKGGSNNFKNLVVLCPNCHSKIPAK